MIVVHVDDMLLATNDSHQAEFHILRLLRKYGVTNVERAVGDEGSLVLWAAISGCA